MKKHRFNLLRVSDFLFLFLLVFGVQADSKERWLAKSGYGLMFHYEAFKNHTSQSYNKTIDSFDVEGFIRSVESTKAGYIIFVIG
ncbi:MAG: hypothetical protein P8M70_06210, partial [Verrucomicrobiota bacterium]|nr:hypothetical protein [Verrucomicrobiota bacterium]